MFETQEEAKRFFVDKIVAQASLEEHPLSEDEEWMLRFSESDPEFVVGPERLERFEAGISSKAYEAKVADLLRRAFARDIKLDNQSRDVYRQAYTVLRRGDHYLLVMIDQALGSSLRLGRGARVLLKLALFLILVPSAALAFLLAIACAGVVIFGGLGREAVPVIMTSLVCAWAGYYLLSLVIRESRR